MGKSNKKQAKTSRYAPKISSDSDYKQEKNLSKNKRKIVTLKTPKPPKLTHQTPKLPAEMQEAGLERDEVDEYVRWRIINIKSKQNKSV